MIKLIGVDHGDERGDVGCRIYGYYINGTLHIERTFWIYPGGRDLERSAQNERPTRPTTTDTDPL